MGNGVRGRHQIAYPFAGGYSGHRGVCLGCSLEQAG